MTTTTYNLQPAPALAGRQADFEAPELDYAKLCRDLAEITEHDAARERKLREVFEPARAKYEEQERVKREYEETGAALSQHCRASSYRRADLQRSIDAALPLPLKNALRATEGRQDAPGRVAYRSLLDLRYKGSDVAGEVRAIMERLADATAAEQKKQYAPVG
jgi:hypothetical protein